MGALLERPLGRLAAAKAALEGLASEDDLFIPPEPAEHQVRVVGRVELQRL